MDYFEFNRKEFQNKKQKIVLYQFFEYQLTFFIKYKPQLKKI
jgi:hypothetical protein